MRLTTTGKVMRVGSALKLLYLVAATAVLVHAPADARVIKRHDACLFHRRLVGAGTLCSYNCNANGLGCSQQICSGGHWLAALPCPGVFCSRRCG
jgi:hypothetical protein